MDSLKKNLADIPSQYRSIFHPIQEFNQIQSAVFNDVIHSDRHIVLSAPTGSGKTIVFEMAIMKQILTFDAANANKKKLKIIYVAPTKALCNEVYSLWRHKFQTHNLTVVLVTGDADNEDISDLGDLHEFQIAVTTPEKWDSMTRKWRDHHEIAKMIKLVLIDEIHLVGDANRGPTLEAIVSRFKFIQNDQEKGRIRFVAVSASLPNIDDISKWINFGEADDSIKAFRINENERPVQLQRFVYGYMDTGNSFQFGIRLTYELTKIVNRLLNEMSAEKKILIFCHTRNDIEMSLKQLQIDVKLQITAVQSESLRNLSKIIKDEKLKWALSHGFAFHHAGLLHKDREHIEEAYRNGLISILLSTSTLAMGVNLPAHTVIIKSTESFVNGAMRELPETMILQMMGRAGRQQYNKSGRVYIMTKQERVRQYQNLKSGTVPIESHLHKKLAEFLNAEIVLNTIVNVELSLLQWIRTTFLRTCAVKRQIEDRNTDEIDAKLKATCQREIQLLRDSQIVTWIQADGNDVFARPFGHVMAKYFLSISTMNRFHGSNGNESIDDILNKTVNCLEFSEFYLRNSDKKFLNDINGGVHGRTPRFIIPGRILTHVEKISCLLQAILGQIPIIDSSLQMDAIKMLGVADRILKAMCEYFHCEQRDKNCYNAVHSAMILSKSVSVQAWCDLSNFYKHLNISNQSSIRLKQTGIRTVSALLKTEPAHIEAILGEKPPFGTNLIANAAIKLPVYEIQVEMLVNRSAIVRVKQINGRFDSNSGGIVTLLIGDSTNQLILFEEIQGELNGDNVFEKQISCSSKADFGIVSVFHSNRVGVDEMHRIIFDSRPDKIITQPPYRKENVMRKPLKHITNNQSMQKSTMTDYFKIQKQPNASAVSKFNSRSETTIEKNGDVNGNNQVTTSTSFRPNSMTLYDFTYDVSQSQSSQRTTHSNDKPILKPIPSQNTVETPIQAKIQAQKAVNQWSNNGFVTAQSIFMPKCNSEQTNGNQQNGHQNGQPKKLNRFGGNKLYDIDNLFEDTNEDDKVNKNTVGTLKSIVNIGSVASTQDNDSISDILGIKYKSIADHVIENDFDDESDESTDEVSDSLTSDENAFLAVEEYAPLCDEQMLEETQKNTQFTIKSTNGNDRLSTDTIKTNNIQMFDEIGTHIKMMKPLKPSIGKSFLTSYAYKSPSRLKYSSQPVESPQLERKKPRPTIDEMITKGELNFDNNATSTIRTMPKPKQSSTQPPKIRLGMRSNSSGKPSTRTVVATIKNSKQQEPKDTTEANKMLAKCEERFQNDPSYKQIDFERDQVRYGVLKFTPPTKKDRTPKESPFPIKNNVSSRYSPFLLQKFDLFGNRSQYSR